MWGLAGFLIGLVLGSFVKALADRSLAKKSFWGRSYCPKCQHKLAWYDLLPVFSYILLSGKCRYCHKKIGREYLLVELVMGILIGFLFWQTPIFIASPAIGGVWQSFFQYSVILSNLVFKTFFIVILVALFLTDLKKMLIPDRIMIPSIIIGFVGLMIITIYKVVYLYYYLSSSPIGQKLLPPHSDYFQRHALIAAEPLLYGIGMGLAIALFFFSLIVITRGKGMGGGDVKLGGFIGLMLGFPGALLAFVLSFFTGAIFGIGMILMGKKHFGQTIPFGPFLVLGSLITLFWGNQIVEWYLRIGR